MVFVVTQREIIPTWPSIERCCYEVVKSLLDAIQTNKTPVILRTFGRAFSVVYLSKAVRWRTFFAKFYESKWGCCILATTCSVGHQCEYS